MKDMIESRGKIEEDYNSFQSRKIYSVPDMYINGVPYRGSWYGRYIFNSICSGFLNDPICSDNEPTSYMRTKRVNRNLIIILCLIIFSVLIFSLICYKKCINVDLENMLNKKIQEHVMNTLSEYKSFQGNTSSSKLEITS